MSTGNRIKQTLLNVGVDPKGIKDLDRMVKQFQALEKAMKDAGKSLKDAVPEITKDNLKKGGTPVDIGQTTQYRKLLDAQKQNIKGVSNQFVSDIVNNKGLGLTRSQKADVQRSFNNTFKEMMGDFTGSLKKQVKAQRKTLNDFYTQEFNKRPEIARRTPLTQNQARSLRGNELQAGLEATKVQLRGARAGLSFAQKNEGNDKLLTQANSEIKRLSKNLKLGNERFEDQTRILRKQSNVAAKAGFKDPALARSTSFFYNDQFRRNPATSRLPAIDGSSLGTLGAGDLRAQIASQKLLLKGANSARDIGQETRNTKLESQASRSIKSLSENLDKATLRLKELEKAARDAAAAEKRATTAETRKVNQQSKEQLRPTDQQRRVNNAMERNKQNSVNRNIDGGAGLFRQQASLLRNYAVLGGGVAAGAGAVSFAVELQKEFKQLQSIVALTNTEMTELEETLIGVSEKTKFSALDVTQAAVTLGQAGLGKNDIGNAIEGVTLFATAVGSDLKSAVDLATSTLGVFNKDSSEMVNIVDKMTTAVNSSKLNLDKLALGLQYSGNLAAQSNVSFEETVSALAAMANSGIRSGSTLGTGLRQIIIALQKPSAEFKDIIGGLGLTMDQLDISSRGLVPTLKLLADEGFTVRDAMKSMQVRAASAFGAFANNIDVADELQKKMRLSGSATQANAVQMTALAFQLERLYSIMKSIAFNAFEPVINSLTKLVEKTGDWLSQLREMKGLISLIGPGLAIYATAVGARSVGRLGVGLLSGGASLLGGAAIGGGKKASPESRTMGKLATAISGRGGLLSVLGGLSRLLSFLPGFGIAVAAGTAGVLAYNALDSQERSRDRVDTTQARINENDSDIETYEARVTKINAAIIELMDNQHLLADDKELNRRIQRLNDDFKLQGLYLDDNVTSYANLIDKMKEFRNEAIENRDVLTFRDRDSFLENNKAVIDELFSNDQESETILDSRFDRLINQTDPNADGARNNVRSPAFGDRRNVRGNSRKSTPLDFLNTIFPDFDTQLSGINKNLALARDGGDGSLGASGKAVEDLNTLVSELTTFVNGGKITQEKLLAQVFGDDESLSKKRSKDLIKEVLNSLQQRQQAANKVQGNLKQFDDSNETKIRQETLRKKTITDGPGEQVIQIKEEFQSAFEEVIKKNQDTPDAEQDYIALYDSVELLAAKADKELDAITEAAEAMARQLVEPGTEEEVNKRARKLLRETRFNALAATAESNVNDAQRQAAELATPDVNFRFSQQEKGLANLISPLEVRLRDSLDIEESGELINKIMEYYRQKVDIETARLVFDSKKGKGLSGEALEVRNREAEIDKRTKLGELNSIASKNQSRVDIGNALTTAYEGDGQLNLSRTKFSDDDLSKQITNFVGAVKTTIADELKTSENRADIVGNTSALRKVDAERSLELGENEAYTGRARRRNIADSESSIDEVSILDAQSIDIRRRALASAIADYQKLIEILNSQVVNNEDLAKGKSKTAAIKQVADLEKLVTNQKKSLIDLDSQAAESAEGVDKFGRTLTSLKRDLEGGSYDTNRQRKIKAQVYGTSYTPIGETVADNTYAENESGGLGTKLTNGFNGALEELNIEFSNFDAISTSIEGLTDLAKGMGDTFANAFTQFATGALSAEEATKQLFASMLQSMLNIVAQSAFKQLLSTVFGSLAGGTLGGETTGGGGGVMGPPPPPTGYTGGEVMAGGAIGRGYYGGGLISSGIGSRDSTNARVARGEFILRKKAVDALGVDTVRALNSGDPNIIAKQTSKVDAGTMPTTQDSSGGGKTVNMYVVTPDQVPQNLGPNDVVHAVSDNLMRGGSLKTLIKRINMDTL